MQRTFSPGWLMPTELETLTARLRGVPDALGRHWPLFVLIPLVLTLAWVILLQEVVVSLRLAAFVFARIVVYQFLMALCGTLALAVLPPRLTLPDAGSLTRFFAVRTAIVVFAVVVGGELGMTLFWWIGIDSHFGDARTVTYGIGFVFGMLAQALALLYDGLALRARQGEIREEGARRDALQARLEALQARTNPHFLFNSLNTIAGLIAVDPERAERAIETLSEVMRYALDSARQRFVPLADEIEAVRSYLALEQLRHGDRLVASVEVDSALEGAPVPPLCLQPIVENAVLHGIGSREGIGHLSVTGVREGSDLVLRTRDDGPGPGASRHHGTGSALRDLRSRLGLLYADRAALEVDAPAMGGCDVTLRLPLAPATEPAP